MPPSSSDSTGPMEPPDDPPVSPEDLYWDIDSAELADPGASAGQPAVIDPAPRHWNGDTSPAETGGTPPAAAPRDRSRSLRKPRSEPLPFHTPGAASDQIERLAEALPLSASDLAPRTPRAETDENTEPAPSAVRMPLQRKSSEGVEKFTRFTTRPELAGAPVPASAVERQPRENGPAGLGRLKESALPVYQSSRLQEVMDHTAAHTSFRRAGRPHRWRRRIGTLLFVLTIAGLGAALVWTWTRKPADAAQDAPGLPLSSSAAAPDSSSLPPLAKRQEIIREGFQALQQASGWEAKLPWVLNAERLSGRMKDFYLSQKGTDPAITSVGVSQPIPSGGAWWFLLTLTTEEGAVIRIAAKETPGGPRFDWENLVDYGVMPFPVFCAEKPKTPQSLRLRIKASSVYEGTYSKNEYLACDISPRGGSPVLHAYAPLSSPAASQVQELTAGPDWNPSLLSLHWDPKGEAVIIDQAGEIVPPGGETGEGASTLQKTPAALNNPPARNVQNSGTPAESGAPKHPPTPPTPEKR